MYHLMCSPGLRRSVEVKLSPEPVTGVSENTSGERSCLPTFSVCSTSGEQLVHCELHHIFRLPLVRPHVMLQNGHCMLQVGLGLCAKECLEPIWLRRQNIVFVM